MVSKVAVLFLLIGICAIVIDSAVVITRDDVDEVYGKEQKCKCMNRKYCHGHIDSRYF